jgi:cytidylate kinase
VSQSGDPFVIALDGPAASGKSSVGLGVARRLGLRYFDTGLLYRVLTWVAHSEGVPIDDEAGLAALTRRLGIEVDENGRVSRDGRDITELLHTPAVDAAVSIVSAHPAVRGGLRSAQRALITPPGLVMAGRDIGTAIVPEAPLKIWLDANVEERARRRAAQTGQQAEAVLAGMRERDILDASRAVAPMAKAADAIVVHTDGMPLDGVIEAIVHEAVARGAAEAAQRP